MKTIILIIAAIVLSSSPLFSQTQAEVNSSSYSEFQRVEKHRRQTITKIKKLYSNQPEFLTAFSDSEQKWEIYRDAFLEMVFPGKNKTELYGSLYPMAYNQQKIRLTQMHIQELQIWVSGIEEGDIGWGSAKMKHAIQQ